jgi:hypothetical protein
VQGEAYHKGRVLFSPGIIEAYKLESEVAKYPRIIVTEPVRQAVWGYHTGLYKGRLLKRDVDGCWFVNILIPPLSAWKALSDTAFDEDKRKYLKGVRRKLLQQLRGAQENLGDFSKVWWLVHKFNKAASAEGLKIIDHPHGSPHNNRSQPLAAVPGMRGR